MPEGKLCPAKRSESYSLPMLRSFRQAWMLAQRAAQAKLDAECAERMAAGIKPKSIG